MKKTIKYFSLLLLVIGFAQVDAKEEDYSNMSSAELDAAFVLAVKESHPEKVQELLQAGANVNTPIPYTWTFGDCDWDVESTALRYAVRNNCPKLVRVLLKDEANLNDALEEAIIQGYPAVVDELLDGGADINHVNKDENTPLILAVQHSRAISEFSLQAQARANSRWSQRRQIIQSLLKAGANVTHANRFGRTALMEAIKEADLNTVQRLLETPEMNSDSFFDLGTNPINFADKDGNTALLLAIKNVRYTYINAQEHNICLNTQNIINELLEAPGIDLFHVNNNGESALTLLEELLDKMSGFPY